MSGFISRAACLGRRPSQFADYSGYQRTGLMARLLRERTIARFVVAPRGFGKTSLLIDYAETIFSWVHVFWINGLSPCFIRDLDNGAVASDCLSTDPEAKLVVIDDLPTLDAERAEALSAQVDELLAARCEVVLACTPSCDVFGALQRDRMRISAADLLLADDEIEGTQVAGVDRFALASQVPPCKRVPALAWQDEPGTEIAFMKGALKEPMPSDLLLSMTSMFVMHEGPLAALRNFGPLDLDLIVQLAQDYPHLGFDEDTGLFQTPLVDADDLATALKGTLASVLECSSFATREELVRGWADALVADVRDHARACAVMRALCPREQRAGWLSENAFQLLGAACPQEGALLAKSIRKTPKDGTPEQRLRCVAFEAVCCALLGDKALSLKLAKQVAFEASVPAAVRICGLLCVARCGNELAQGQAHSALAKLVEGYALNDPASLSPWQQLAVCWLKRDAPFQEQEWWASLMRADAPYWVKSLGAGWCLHAALASVRPDGSDEALESYSRLTSVASYVRDSLADPDLEPDLYVASAGIALAKAMVKGAFPTIDPLPTAMAYKLRLIESGLAQQQQAYAAQSKSDVPTRQPAAQTLAALEAASNIAGASMQRQVPVLKLQMFGRFEASIGGVPLDHRAFRRRHVRLLLLIVTMNIGREVSRDNLARALWPDADVESSRKSLYTAWSKLRRALTLPDGTCPYLIRYQYGCALSERYVQSDVVRLNEICRELLFGKTDFRGWRMLYNELENDFSNELLPSEAADDLVIKARKEYQSKLVDAMVSATLSLIDGGSLQLATWYARAAVGHDETREDAHVALMRAQIANKQRTAAMESYHRCRRILADQLGVDPSPETTALYESLLHSERQR